MMAMAASTSEGRRRGGPPGCADQATRRQMQDDEKADTRPTGHRRLTPPGAVHG